MTSFLACGEHQEVSAQLEEVALFRQLSVPQCDTENFLGLWDVRVPGNLAGVRVSVYLSVTIRLLDPQVNLEVRVSRKGNHCQPQPLSAHPCLLREACAEMGGSEYTKGKGLAAPFPREMGVPLF